MKRLRLGLLGLLLIACLAFTGNTGWWQYGSANTSDFFLEIAKGNVPGHYIVHKFGRNPDTDQIASATAVIIGRDIWDLGIAGATMWVPPTAARVHQIASSDDEDGGAGTDTGALTLRVFGLDASFALTQEDIVLNGTTDVATSAMTMIYRMEVLTAGTAGRNLGNIDATADVDGTVTARVTINNNQSAMAIYQVPAATTCYEYGNFASLHKAGGAATFADTAIMLKDFGGVWRLQDAYDLATDGQPHVHHPETLPNAIPAKSYVKMVANPSKDAQDVSAGFDLLCIKDD